MIFRCGPTLRARSVYAPKPQTLPMVVATDSVSFAPSAPSLLPRGVDPASVEVAHGHGHQQGHGHERMGKQGDADEDEMERRRRSDESAV